MPLLSLFWSMLLFFLFIIWIWLVITVFMDVFRSDDLSGGAKAMWILLLVFLPYLGVLIYVIARGNSMQERAVKRAAAYEEMQRAYIERVASSSPAEELAKLKGLHDQGVLTDAEFEAEKAKVLA